MPKVTGSNFDPSHWLVQSIDSPFKLYKIREVFSDEQYVKKLSRELEKLDFTHAIGDLFSLHQSLNLSHLKNDPKFPMLSKFLHFLDEFKIILSEEMNINLEPTISVSSSKYCKEDFLLCHDDHFEDRYIAFIYYLNPIWKPEWGGSLDIFEHDEDGQPSQIVYNICPEFNTLVFFQVGDYTYHQVAEVVSDETPRITINGWFHGKEALNLKPLPYYDNDIFVRTHNLGALIYLQHFLNEGFLNKRNKSLIRNTWKENNVVMLQEFLKPKIFERISRELCSTGVKWKQKGPANRRRYTVVEESSLPSLTRAFLNLVRSNPMCSYLEEISRKNLLNATDEDGSPCGSVQAEIQSWKSTCYSLLHDSDARLSNDTLEMWLFFNVHKDENVVTDGEEVQPGSIFYCSANNSMPDREIEAVNNSVCWVRKPEGQSSFVSYISATSELKYHALRVCYKI